MGKRCCEEKPGYLETAGSTGRAVWQHILYEYPGDILGLTGAAIVQIDLKREIDRRLNVPLNGTWWLVVIHTD